MKSIIIFVLSIWAISETQGACSRICTSPCATGSSYRETTIAAGTNCPTTATFGGFNGFNSFGGRPGGKLLWPFFNDYWYLFLLHCCIFNHGMF